MDKEKGIETREALAVFIANNLYRQGNSKNSDQTALLLLTAAASLLGSGDDPQIFASAKRLTQLAMSRQKRK